MCVPFFLSYNAKSFQPSSEPPASCNLFAGRKFQILQELSKYDKETWSEQMMLENDTDMLAWPRVATNLKFVKMKYLWSAIKQRAIKWGMPIL